MDYNLKLSSEHTRLVIASLAELPYKMAAPVVESIMQQADAQEKAAADAQKQAVQPPPAQPGNSAPAA